MHSSRMRTAHSSSRHKGGLHTTPLPLARPPSTSPLGVGLDQIPLNFPLGVGLDQIPLNFPLGCGSGPDPPQLPLGCGPPQYQIPPDQAPPPPWTDTHLKKHNLRKLRLRAVKTSRQGDDSNSHVCIVFRRNRSELRDNEIAQLIKCTHVMRNGILYDYKKPM